MGIFDEFEKKLQDSVEANESDESKASAQAAERENRWKQKRIGKITSSNLDKLMNLSKDGRIKTKAGIDYLLEIQHQKDTGCDSEEVYAKAFLWGKAFEEEALFYYNKITGNNVISGLMVLMKYYLLITLSKDLAIHLTELLPTERELLK